MKSLLIKIFILFFLILSFILFDNDYFASIVPGWNTKIYPLWLVITLILVFSLIVVFLISMAISVFKLFSQKKINQKTL